MGVGIDVFVCLWKSGWVFKGSYLFHTKWRMIYRCLKTAPSRERTIDVIYYINHSITSLTFTLTQLRPWQRWGVAVTAWGPRTDAQWIHSNLTSLTQASVSQCLRIRELIFYHPRRFDVPRKNAMSLQPSLYCALICLVSRNDSPVHYQEPLLFNGGTLWFCRQFLFSTFICFKVAKACGFSSHLPGGSSGVRDIHPDGECHRSAWLRPQCGSPQGV